MVPKERKDKDGNVTTRPILAPVFIEEGQDPPDNARHLLIMPTLNTKSQPTMCLRGMQ